MAGIVNVEVGEDVPVELQIVDGNTAQHPRVWITNDANSWSVTLDLVHVAHGLYRPAAPYVMPDENWVSCTYIVYEDAGHSIESTTYVRDADVFMKTIPGDFLLRALGLMQENQYIDNAVYTGNKMTSARLRIYSDPASVGTAADVIGTYDISVTYNGNDMDTYKVVKA